MTFALVEKSGVCEILSLNQDNFADGWNEKMLLDAFDSGRFFVIGAFLENELIGYVSFSLAISDADIEGVVVKKAFTGQGIGKKLMDNAHEFIKNKGADRILLEVRENNKIAKGLYEKAGYTTISVRKNYYNDGENALVMLKEL